MKHRVAGRKLGRTSAHRLALLRNLSTELFDKERVRTTLGKAKEVRPFAERLVTLAKRETLHARRQVLRHIHDKDVVAKLFDTISARFAQRPGGYTRIIKLGPRRGDAAETALIELVGSEAQAKPEKAGKGAGAAGKGGARKPAAKPAEETPKGKAAKGGGASGAKPARKTRAKAEPKDKTAKAAPKAKGEAKGRGKKTTTTPRKAGGS